MHKKITINDVAQQAGVSKKTVSRVINNEPHVSLATRDRIQEVMRRLAYSPDPQARGLAFKRSYLLGLIYDNPVPAFVTDSIYGVLDSCRPQGYELITHPCDGNNPQLGKDITQFITRLKLDGVIVLPPVSESTQLIEAIENTNKHYVRLCSVNSGDPLRNIHYKDRLAASNIADHLVSLGHKKIAFIKGPEGYLSANERYLGFSEGLANHGINLPAHRIANGDYTYQSGVACTEWLLNAIDRPTAIFASNDEMAMGVMVVAAKMGIKIPIELSVVGYNDSPQVSQVWPALTTVNLHIRKMGQLAAEKLLALCQDDPVTAAKIPAEVMPTFIQRQSTAPPPV